MIPTAAEFDQFKCRLIGWILQLESTPTLEAADQLLRSRIHPVLYDCAQRLQGIMQHHGPRFVRRVQQRVGTADILRIFPQSFPYIHAYEQASGETVLRAQMFRDLAVLAAIVDRAFLERLTRAVIIQSVIQDMLHHFEQQNGNHIARDRFWQAFDQLKRAEQGTPDRITPEAESVVVRVHGDSSYTVGAHVRMVDSLRHAYHVELQHPVLLRNCEVDHILTVPLERALQHGLLLDIAFEHAYQLYTEPIRCTILTEQLQQIRARGSAVYAYIGRTGEFRLYEEDLEPFPGEVHPLPAGHVAAIRVTPTLAEITRLDRSTRLTVFV